MKKMQPAARPPADGMAADRLTAPTGSQLLHVVRIRPAVPLSRFVSLLAFVLSAPGPAWLTPPLLAAPSPADALLSAGDRRYLRRDYDEAHLFYLQAFDLQPAADSASRLLLSHLRRREANPDATADGEAVRRALILNHEGPFAYHYVALFTAYRIDRPDAARYHEQILERILAKHGETPSSRQERYWFRLLQGHRLIQEKRWAEAEQHYAALAAEPGEAGELATRLGRSLARRNSLPQKSPWIALSLSAVLPGAGQFYTRHYSDGVMAFFWNATFLGGGAYTYRLEQQAGRPHNVSIVALLAGLVFYAANVAGAYTSANQYNAYQERVFYQSVRDTSFNVDLVERTAGIEFTRPLQ